MGQNNNRLPFSPKKYFIFAAAILTVVALIVLFRFSGPAPTVVQPQYDFKVSMPEEWQGGANIPENIISPDEAVAKAKQVNGYADEEILEVAAAYGENSGAWYWGVKTPRGTVTVKADR